MTLFLYSYPNPPLVGRHQLQNSRRWASRPLPKAPRCSAAPVMGSLRASCLLSIPHPAPDPSIRNASPASFRVRWDGCVSVCEWFNVLSLFLLSSSFSFPSPLDVVVSSHYNKSVCKCHLTAWAAVSAGPHSECMTMCAPAYGRATVRLHDADEVVWSEEVKGLMERGWLIKCVYSPSPL